MSLRNIPKHAPTDQRNLSDGFHLPTHFDFRGSIESDIQELCARYDYVTVSDVEMIEKRIESKFSMSQGDAVEAVLRDKRQDYEGMVFWQAVERLGLEIDDEDDPNNMPSNRRLAQIGEEIDNLAVQTKMRVKDARYSEKAGVMFYFLTDEMEEDDVQAA